MKPPSISKAETEWLNGPDRRVVVHARKLKDERKRLLFLCGFFNPHRSLLSNASILKAMDVVERYADGLASDDHFARAVGIISVFDWFPTSLPNPPGLDLIAVVRAASSSKTADVESRMPMLKNVAIQASLLRDVFGNPFRPTDFPFAWRTSDAIGLAQTMYDAHNFANMPILADALQDAGCDHASILDHCRGAGTHVRGCWVVDLVLGK